MPVAFMMGIPFDETTKVAELIGTKLFLNEFLAYEKLADLKKNRLDGLEEIINSERMWISVSVFPSLSTCIKFCSASRVHTCTYYGN